MEHDLCDTSLHLGIGRLRFSADDGRRVVLKPPEKLLDPLCPPCINEEEEDRPKTSSMKERSSLHVHSKRTKKLRLSKEQSDLLEASFRSQRSVTSLQKQQLALKLGLLPRQVEVWFQNRRARTKVKQIEDECELLGKWCKELTDQNQKLLEEMEKLRHNIKSLSKILIPEE
ncbi:hypothetical protein HPP92_027663 [Vanilla planifolia]|uniref:Homeobox domain-containing protein n=1 Tax=Vanilla planifolia TaxID=51239 RepID=A0A835P890_VANPL|nr:hypothetical protein HPP92_027663 [Vanilla planifolia]